MPRFTIYGDDEDGYTIADDQVWVPGIYATPDTAKRAAEQFTNADLETLQRIWRIDGECRQVTMTDLDELASRT